ncbi:hypothetical protein Q4566_03085 [Tamlana sp. 2_MG-2023]|uniref:LOG family protein n=1 Tax=unclassified Tamlana TaxID=2614803 RepID=UPI0026E3D659|nr:MULTISPECIES: hypothetical protein [unclassified Tamlana]MDO6759171.1 hypothetical protein [Tamlana sp. 2_MG-2023]MDO6790690.1 hypothetical protein [Tamlana sp. 1_MG-2023]
MTEIDDLLDFENWVNSGAKTPVALQELNLLAYDAKIFEHTFKDAMFLGCDLTNEAAGHIVKTGGMIISNRKDQPFKMHKARLYSVEELFKGFDINNEGGYKDTFDYKVYKDYVENGLETPASIHTSLARRLHDHSITDALYELIEDRKVVAIMGGHAMERQDPYYLEIAKISRTLTRKGFLMVSGGGPGAMEATHLGAYFACRTENELIEAVNEFKTRPVDSPKGKEYDDKDWLHRAWKIMTKYPIPPGKEKASMSIGVPTWLYGHEPPAPFATHIAKYFANSVREDGLLTIAKYGVIFAPGSAGTTQEIFQDATQNHYAPYNIHATKKYVSPMILFGIKAWTVERPLWNFMKQTSEGRPYGELLHLTEDTSEVINHILNYNPENYAFPK